MTGLSAGGGVILAGLVALGAAAPLPVRAAEQGGESQLVPSAKPPWEQPSAAAPARPPKPLPAPPKAQAQAPAATNPPPPEKGSEPRPAAEAAVPPTAPLLAVVKWSFSASLAHEASGGLAIAATAGRPLYLWLTIRGGQAALDRLQSGPIAIDVHWAREGAGAGAPELTTKLTIGRPGLAAALAGQVKARGQFEWRLWARKDALSPGRWTVSLTYPDGQPVQCGEKQPQPCRLPIEVG